MVRKKHLSRFQYTRFFIHGFTLHKLGKEYFTATSVFSHHRLNDQIFLVCHSHCRMQPDYLSPWMEFSIFQPSSTWSQKFSSTYLISFFFLLMNSGWFEVHVELEFMCWSGCPHHDPSCHKFEVNANCLGCSLNFVHWFQCPCCSSWGYLYAQSAHTLRTCWALITPSVSWP